MQLKKISLLFLTIFCMHLALNAQDVTGSWFAVGTIEGEGNNNNYLSELVLTKNGNNIKGQLNYYYKDSLFKVKIKGSFSKNTRLLKLDPFPVIFYRSRSTKNGVDCSMLGNFTLRVAKTGAVLRGELTSAAKNQYSMPDINYRFERSREPDYNSKSTNELVNSDTPTIQTNNVKPIPAIAFKKEKILTIQPLPLTELPAVKNAVIKVDSTKEIFLTRKKVYAREITVEQSIIRIEIYDNGEVDYDSASLFLNDQLIMPKTMLNHRSVKLKLQLDTQLPFNELALFAENLGRIPPNTAALIIHDGEKKYEVVLNSDFSKNAIIKIKTKQPVNH